MALDPKTSIVNRVLAQLGQEPVPDLSAASLAYSVAAVKILRVIDDARDDVLARHGWTCALEYVTLTPATIQNYVPPRYYPWVFLLPSGALRVWTVAGNCAGGVSYGGLEPRWQAGTTEVDGSDRQIVRAGPPADLQALDGIVWGGPDGYYYGEGWSPAPSSCDPIPIIGYSATSSATPWPGPRLDISYVRRADWGSLDANLKTGITYKTAEFACYSITGDLARGEALAKKAEAYIAAAIGDESNQEGGQPPLGGSIPLALRSYGRV